MSPPKLKGMTWSHPRGTDPMVACSKLWLEKTGVEISWDKRSLQDFESFPVDDLARRYDLIVIDHPHVGEIVAQDCLAALDVPDRTGERLGLSRGSVGRSYASYTYQGRQWAFPIDAAAQVQAWRADLLGEAPSNFGDVLALAANGKVLLPMRPPHSLMTFFTLAANLGTPCRADGSGLLIDGDAGERVYRLIADLMRLVPEECYDLNPIAVSERMSAQASGFACAPFIYGYVNYGIAGFRPHMLAFSNIPVCGAHGPTGSAIGGTGIAVSAFSSSVAQATDFAYWIAGADIQSGPFAASGGQPGHAAGWEADAVNKATNNFYRNTRQTLEGGWLRPRHKGYMAFQAAASERLNHALRSGETASAFVAALNAAFRASFAPDT